MSRGDQGKTLKDSAREVAREFLQSVVLVDDMAFFGSRPTPASSSGAGATGRTGGMRQRRSKLPMLVAPTAAESGADVPDQALDAKRIIDGFAEFGLVCAVMRPDKNEALVGRVVHVAQRADIVVLDWELNGDGGKISKSIIRRVVNEESDYTARSRHPRLRLVAIYSGTIDLSSITRKVLQVLKGLKGVPSLKEEGSFAIVVGFVRIVIFAKPTSRMDAGGAALAALRERQVEPDALPARLIEEFSALTMGLVPHVALASLASLRRNTHRILARLRADLDPGYLWHRATQARPADAEEHLVQLVTSEFRSVLDDERVGRRADITAIRQWLDGQNVTDFKQAFKSTKPISVEDVALLLERGTAGGDAPSTSKEFLEKFRVMSKDPHKKQEVAAFASDSAQAIQSNERLAALMSLRQRYDNPPPRLELGTIVSVVGRTKTTRRKARPTATGSQDDPRSSLPIADTTKLAVESVQPTYWLCVQPVCDSVRLNGIVPFPFVPLELAKPDTKFDLLLPAENDTYLRLRVVRKPRSLMFEAFAVHPDGNDSIAAQRRGRDQHYAFRSSKERWYRWEAELKPEQAQRIIQQVATEFARVGLTESEWLRLWSTK
jgi:hypothetical protein